MTEGQSTRQSRDTIEAERELFRRSDIWRVRILGINALGLLHRHASGLIRVLRNGGTVEVLLLDSETAEFRKRRDAEEKRGGMVSDRLEAEMGASNAMLRDILNLLLHEHGHDIETLEERFRFRLHGGKSNTSLLFVETTSGRFLLRRKLPLVLAPSYDSSTCTVVALYKGEASGSYDKALKRFHETWDGAQPISLDHLKSSFRIVAPRKKDVSHVYAQAGRATPAKAARRGVVALRDHPQARTAPPADRRAGRVGPTVPAKGFLTPGEPFKFRDLVAVVHPDAKQRLIGYHLIWEDDIDYLTDNDPADHEVVWVKYSKDRKVEAAWSYWHADIVSTSRAAPDANAHACRVKINVQWGETRLLPGRMGGKDRRRRPGARFSGSQNHSVRTLAQGTKPRPGALRRPLAGTLRRGPRRFRALLDRDRHGGQARRAPDDRGQPLRQRGHLAAFPAPTTSGPRKTGPGITSARKTAIEGRAIWSRQSPPIAG